MGTARPAGGLGAGPRGQLSIGMDNIGIVKVHRFVSYDLHCDERNFAVVNRDTTRVQESEDRERDDEKCFH